MEKMDITPKRRFLKIGDLAAQLHCSVAKAYRMVEAGEVRSVKVGGLLRVPAEELDRLAGQPESAAR